VTGVNDKLPAPSTVASPIEISSEKTSTEEPISTIPKKSGVLSFVISPLM